MRHLFTQTDPYVLAMMYKHIANHSISTDPLIQFINRYLPLSTYHRNPGYMMGQLTSRENYYPIANPIAGLDSIVKSIIIAIAKNSLPDIISAAFVGTCRVCEQYLAYYLHLLY